jgi:hypothetical protein
MELSPSWEATSHAATQEFPKILWNPKVYCYVYKSLPLVPILSQINPVHPPHSLSIRPIKILTSYLRLGRKTGLFPTGVPNKIHCPPPCVPYILPASFSLTWSL